MEQTYNGGTSTLGSTGERPTPDFRGVLNDAEELIRAVANLGGESVAQARAKLEERLTQVRGMLADGEVIAREKAKMAAQQADAYVHERPWQAVGIGVAIGIVLGFISRR
jgi:ElaB/YqjD/DUF883 family membrane-anchored ribosome-binding protein